MAYCDAKKYKEAVKQVIRIYKWEILSLEKQGKRSLLFIPK